MRIAVIGAGSVGAAVGRAWAGAGHAVVYGVRDPGADKHRAVVAGTSATTAAPSEAVAGADVVVLALPWTVAATAVPALGDLAGRTVIDCMNPLAMVDGALSLERGFSTSGGETVAGWLPGANVVKALNTVGAEVMAQASAFASRPAMFMAGDDASAKASVASLLTDLGFEPFDAGALRQARLLEPLAMVWINQALFRGLGRAWAFGVLRRD